MSEPPLVRLGQGDYQTDLTAEDLESILSGNKNAGRRESGLGAGWRARPRRAGGTPCTGSEPKCMKSDQGETMGMLQKVYSDSSLLPRRVLLYGTHGIGKSTFGSMADKPIFIQTEDGLNGINCARFPLANRYSDVLNAITALYTEDHDFETVVIDSLDWLERLIWADVCEKRGVESIEDIGYQKGYTFALTQWREVLAGLDALRNDIGMMIILIAHAAIEKVADPEVDTYDRYSPRLHKHASALIQEWCDEVLFAKYRVHTKQTKEAFNQTRTQGIGTGERLVYTTERPGHLAKNRLNLPDEIPLDFRVYDAFLHGENPLAKAE